MMQPKLFVLFLCKHIVLEDNILNGGILVNDDGKISQIFNKQDADKYILEGGDTVQVIDVGEYFLMPGIIDTHVHINEPGRTDWEGFESVTKAAAAGGITTIVDMPLNSIPPTTTLENFKTKINSARDKVYVDVAFWGGVVPGNQNELLNMTKAGVIGFKCFLCPSGVDEFNHVNIEDVKKALEVLKNSNAVLAFHAEIDENIPVSENPEIYQTFLKSRPDSMEINAIRNIIELSEKYNVRTHIVHLSTADALPLIEKAKKSNPRLSVETCHHYLTFHAEEIPDKATQFKCTPPIRSFKNQQKLWSGLRNNVIDTVVSDHSPCTADLKLLDEGNFLKAWGGIASVQFGLSIFWTEMKERNMSIFDINKYMSRNTAALVGLHNSKGKISENYDADFVIWDPDSSYVVHESSIHHKNKVTPYLGRKLWGKVIKTVVRGEIVYEDGKNFSKPTGKLLINENF